MPYTEEFKENFINEFLDRYQKDQTLSLRQFGIEKLGKVSSFIYLWLPKYDYKGIYKVNKNKGPRKKVASTFTSPVVKISNKEESLKSKVKANITIKIGNDSIDLGNNYTKEDLVLVLSALKEVNNVN